MFKFEKVMSEQEQMQEQRSKTGGDLKMLHCRL